MNPSGYLSWASHAGMAQVPWNVFTFVTIWSWQLTPVIMWKYNCIVIGWWCVDGRCGNGIVVVMGPGSGHDGGDGDRGDGDGDDAPQSPALLSDIRV